MRHKAMIPKFNTLCIFKKGINWLLFVGNNFLFPLVGAVLRAWEWAFRLLIDWIWCNSVSDQDLRTLDKHIDIINYNKCLCYSKAKKKIIKLNETRDG